MTLSSRHRIRNKSALAVWGRARYLLVMKAPHNTNFHTWMGKKHFCFFQTAGTGNRTPNSGVKGSGTNHYTRAPALQAGTFNHRTSPPPHVGLLVSWWASWALEIIPQTTWGGGGALNDTVIPATTCHANFACSWSSMVDAGLTLNQRYCDMLY